MIPSLSRGSLASWSASTPRDASAGENCRSASRHSAGTSWASRGGDSRVELALLHPAGVVLEQRPSMQWESVPGVAEYQVDLLTRTGTRVWRTTCKDAIAGYPADQQSLERGASYLIEIRVESPLGTMRTVNAFRVATEEEREAFDRAVQQLGSTEAPDVALLARAQLAIWRKYY